MLTSNVSLIAVNPLSGIILISIGHAVRNVATTGVSGLAGGIGLSAAILKAGSNNKPSNADFLNKSDRMLTSNVSLIAVNPLSGIILISIGHAVRNETIYT